MRCASAYGREGFIPRRRLLTIWVTIIPPAHRSAVGAQSASMRRAGGYGCEGETRRRRHRSPPAYRSAVGAQPAGITLTGAYGCEDTRRRRHRNSKASCFTPAHRRAVLSQTASMKPAVGYGFEGFIRRRRCLPVVVRPPAYRSAVRAKAADMTKGTAPAEAYRRKGFSDRRIHRILALFTRHHPSAPAHHSAIRRANATALVPAGAYGAKRH